MKDIAVWQVLLGVVSVFPLAACGESANGSGSAGGDDPTASCTQFCQKIAECGAPAEIQAMCRGECSQFVGCSNSSDIAAAFEMELSKPCSDVDKSAIPACVGSGRRCPESWLITTDEQFTAFVAEECTEVGGLLIANGISLTSLNGLEDLTTVTGNLSIESTTTLVSLSGLGNLTSVGGDFFISGNAGLTSLGGLESLTSVAGGFSIGGSPLLSSLSGLGELTSVGGEFAVTSTASASLTGVPKLASVGALRIVGNDALASLDGLENLVSVAGEFAVFSNPTLASLSGLQNIRSVGTAGSLVGALAIQDIDIVSLDPLPFMARRHGKGGHCD